MARRSALSEPLGLAAGQRTRDDLLCLLRCLCLQPCLTLTQRGLLTAQCRLLASQRGLLAGESAHLAATLGLQRLVAGNL